MCLLGGADVLLQISAKCIDGRKAVMNDLRSGTSSGRPASAYASARGGATCHDRSEDTMSAARENGADAGADWADDHRFEVITSVPVVRDAVSACAAHARVPLSVEEFLQRAAVVFPALGRALDRGAAARGRQFALKRGWRTGRSREAETSAPVGRVIASVLCSMALHGQVVHSVEQGADGCTLIAEIPADRKTFGGVLHVRIARGAARGSVLQAQAEIPGQLYDWGKSKQTIADLFAGVLALPGARTPGTVLPAAPPAP